MPRLGTLAEEGSRGRADEALRGKKRVTVTITVTVTDAAGDAVSRKLTPTVTR